MDKAHDIKKVVFEGNVLLLVVDGKEYRIDLGSQSPILEKASKAERENFVISPTGYGIHWPSLDEDLSIDGIIGVKHTLPKNRATA